MSWGLVAVAGATIIGGVMQSKSAKKAADAQGQGATDAIAAQERARAEMRGDLMPYMDYGKGSLAALSAANAGDYSGFMNSPDYLYAKGEAQYGVEHGAAARGSLYSGGTDIDLARHLSGLASQNFNNWRSSQMGLAQLGQASAAGVGAAGMGAANQIGGYLQNAADGRASSYIAQGNNWANTANQLGQTASSYFGNRSAGG